MKNLPSVKRGDTFEYTATWEGAQLSELKSQVRTASGELKSDVLIEETGEPNTFRFSVEDTSEWPIGTLYTDIQRIAGGRIQSSETMLIPVERDVTQ